MNKSSKINPLKKAFWQAFSLTAFLLFVSQKIDELRQKTPKGIEIATHTPVPLYWASEEKTSPVGNFVYQEIYPAPFQQIPLSNTDIRPPSFDEIYTGEFDNLESPSQILPPPNWDLINGRGNSVSSVEGGIVGGGCMLGMN